MSASLNRPLLVCSFKRIRPIEFTALAAWPLTINHSSLHTGSCQVSKENMRQHEKGIGPQSSLSHSVNQDNTKVAGIFASLRTQYSINQQTGVQGRCQSRHLPWVVWSNRLGLRASFFFSQVILQLLRRAERIYNHQLSRSNTPGAPPNVINRSICKASTLKKIQKKKQKFLSTKKER